MPNFHPLTVTHIDKTTRDAVVLTLAPPGDAVAEFSFAPGQYLTFRQDFDGVELRRSYSICAGIDDGHLQVGIKTVDGGAFSTWANEVLRPGDVIEAMPPMGQFKVPLGKPGPRHYLGFAGGSGITPLLSIIKSVLSHEPDSRFTLIYANRDTNSIMFHEALEDLKNQNMQRFSILHVLEAGQEDMPLLTGRIDQEKCAELLAKTIDISAIHMALICGPEPMMLAIAEALQNAGMNKDQIKYELFASAQTGRAKKRAQSSGATSLKSGSKITVRLDGTNHKFTVGRGTTMLDGLLEATTDVPHACKAGVCSTCKAKVVRGEVEMVANHALEDYEVEAGYVLTCQSYALSEEIELDYDS